MVDRGDVYAENSSGPRTDPWGTPTEHEVTAEWSPYVQIVSCHLGKI